MTVDVDLNHLAEVAFVRFLHEKVIFLPLYCTYWKAIIMCSSHLRSGKLCSTSLRVEYLHKLIVIFLHGRFISYCIKFFLSLFLSVWTLHLFYTLDDNPIVLCFVAQIISVLVIRSISLWYTTIVVYFIIIIIILALSYFLPLQLTPGKFCIFPAWVLSQTFLPGSYSFCWRVVWETNICDSPVMGLEVGAERRWIFV